MRLSENKTKELIEAVRREIVKNPNTTIQEIQQNLSVHYGHVFDKNFIGKLKNKIHKERFQRYDRVVVQYEIAKFEDTIEELCNLLWKIVDDKESTQREIINAIREIRSAKSNLLEIKFESGILERDFEKLIVNKELSRESQDLIETALEYAFNGDKPTRRQDSK